MKKLGLFIFCIVVLMLYSNTRLFAQHTLQFNQVKLVGTVETVPTDKAWKIESVLPATRLTSAFCWGSSSCGSAQTQTVITVDGTSVYLATSDASGSSYMSNATAAVLNTNIWLPAGTTLAAGSGVYKISVIEFNIIAP
ncbi:MAG: hypothetical protein WCM76_13345 [Bacteroidota bacterium]